MPKISIILALFFTSLICAFTSCENQLVPETSPMEETINHQKVGDSISLISQQLLLTNVAREMKAGGPVNAIGFCNINAAKLIDSLSNKYSVKISRVTDKPRNPANRASDLELEILKSLSNSALQDTVLHTKNAFVYYKSIRLGMPTCLKCHGSQTDIDENTLETIQTLYPNDLAKNYQLGDFRGAWKIQFEH